MRDGRRNMRPPFHLRRGRAPLVRRRRCGGGVLAHADLPRTARRLPRCLPLRRHAWPQRSGVAVRCASTCSARRRAGFMSSGPATAALSYALLIACASMPLLLPISTSGGSPLRPGRPTVRRMVSRWSFEMHSKRAEASARRARRPTTFLARATPRRRRMGSPRRASCRFGAYETGGRVATSARGCAHAHVGALARQGRAADKSASWSQPGDCFRRRVPPIARAATVRACHSRNGTTGGTFALLRGRRRISPTDYPPTDPFTDSLVYGKTGAFRRWPVDGLNPTGSGPDVSTHSTRCEYSQYLSD